MKAYQSKHNKSNTQNPNKRYDREASADILEIIAEELTELALKRLPDGVLIGIIADQEIYIRKQAIRLALRWYLLGERIDAEHPGVVWHAPRTIACVLQIVKRDLIKDLLGKTSRREIAPEIPATKRHSAMACVCGSPIPAIRELYQDAIRLALRDGRINPLSAAVADVVHLYGIQAHDLAKRQCVSRRCIEHHLSRVQRHLWDVIKTIEVHSMDPVK